MRAIETARLRLRPFTPEDAAVYHAAIYADAEVMRYLPGGKPRTLERAREAVRLFADLHDGRAPSLYAVEPRAGGPLIGHCGLAVVPDTFEVELGYALARAVWGQGLATEAAQAALRYGFESLDLAEVIAMAVPENLASQRVMQKIGMRHEGLTTTYYNGTELVLYSISGLRFDPGDMPYRLIE